MPPDHTSLKGVSNYEDARVSSQLEANLTAFFDWGLLQAGGFCNATFPAAETRLRRASDPDHGEVYEGLRQGWVWQTGVPSPTAPVAISGVWVNGTMRASGFTVDYPGGRVIFDSPLPSNAQVSCEHSFRKVTISTADAEWFREVQFGTYESADPQFQAVGSGAWDVLSRNRVQLPAIVIESVSRVRVRAKEIGSKQRIHQQDVLFHILTENAFDRKRLHDILIDQWDHQFLLFDSNAVSAADAWPLSRDGSPRAGARTYPEMVAATGDGGFAWREAMVAGVISEPQDSVPPLYRATVRLTMELDLP